MTKIFPRYVWDNILVTFKRNHMYTTIRLSFRSSKLIFCAYYSYMPWTINCWTLLPRMNILITFFTKRKWCELSSVNRNNRRFNFMVKIMHHTVTTSLRFTYSVLKRQIKWQAQQAFACCNAFSRHEYYYTIVLLKNR